MHRFVLPTILLMFMLSISSCGSNEPRIFLRETGNSSNTVAEEININNCGGDTDAVQTTERSAAIEVKGESQIGISADVLYTQISFEYKKEFAYKKTHTVSASPGTHLRVILLWTEEINDGVITVEDENGQAEYRVSTPISVNQVSATDLGCDNKDIVPTLEQLGESQFGADMRIYEFQVSAQTATWGPLQTGIYLNKGDRFEIVFLSGNWWIGRNINNSWKPQNPTNANGYQGAEHERILSELGVPKADICRPLSSAPFGSLIGSLGKFGDLFFIGLHGKFIADDDDILYLGINYSDHNQVLGCPYGDGGAITIRVTVYSGE